MAEANVLTREWYVKLEEQSASNFINLPIEFQIRKHSYGSISKSYLNFFQSESNTRNDKLVLAKKFLKFIRSINKNRAKEELGEEFFECFQYFMENFNDLVSKQDIIHLETLTVLENAIDRSQFIEDIISVDELQRRVKALEVVVEQEDVIELEFEELSVEYGALNHINRDEFLLAEKNIA